MQSRVSSGAPSSPLGSAIAILVWRNDAPPGEYRLSACRKKCDPATVWTNGRP